MIRSEYFANEALHAAAARPAGTPQAGDLFAVRGPMRVYRKPSLLVRILRAFS